MRSRLTKKRTTINPLNPHPTKLGFDCSQSSFFRGDCEQSKKAGSTATLIMDLHKFAACKCVPKNFKLWRVRPVSNVVLLSCRTKLIELMSTLARQWRGV